MNASRHWLPLAAFVLAVALCWPRLRPLEPPRFAPVAQAAPPVGTGAPEAQMLPKAGATAHSVSLAELSDGRIIAAWFAGSREGAPDVAVVMATFTNGQWGAARPIMQRAEVARATGRLVRKLGNPALGVDAQGRLHLWFVSVSYGGWAGSAINHSISKDGGLTWSAPERLITSPFWNLSTLVRSPALRLENGGVGLPVYHEFIAKRPEWLRFDAQGQLVDKARLPQAAASLQPAVAELDPQRAIALLRDAGSAHRIRISTSDSAGLHWQPAKASALPNPNAGIALLRLTDGALLLAYNPLESARNQLALAVSRDEGQHWSPPRMIENGAPEDEFSYPALLQDRQGTVHLAYTWKREAIKHVRFAPAWLEATP